MKLNDAKVRTLKTPGKYADGGGMYLEVTKAGGRYWRMKYRHGGKEKRLAFGVYPAVGLREARQQRETAKQILRLKNDPGQLKREAKAKSAQDSNTSFERIAREWLKHQNARWLPHVAKNICISLEKNIFPILGRRPIAGISPREMISIIKAIEERGASTIAGYILQRVKSIYRYAVTHGKIDTNPMIDLVQSEILKPRKTRHQHSLASNHLNDFLNRLDHSSRHPTVMNALRLLILTTARTAEVRGALWSEFDLTNRTWKIPAQRMKMKVEHIIPLSAQAIEVLESMIPISGTSSYVFPSPFNNKKPIGGSAILQAMTSVGYKGEATPHGFRSLFSTLANEAGWNPDVIERQLAHAEKNQVRAAYNRSIYLPERVRLVQWWGDYLIKAKLTGGELSGA